MQDKQKRATMRESRLAADYGGERVKGSGSGKFKKGDVSFTNALLQDKHTMKESISIKKKDLLQIEEEAMLRGKIPLLSFGFEELIGNPKVVNSMTWLAFPVWWLKNQGDFMRRLVDGEDENL